MSYLIEDFLGRFVDNYLNGSFKIYSKSEFTEEQMIDDLFNNVLKDELNNLVLTDYKYIDRDKDGEIIGCKGITTWDLFEEVVECSENQGFYVDNLLDGIVVVVWYIHADWR